MGTERGKVGRGESGRIRARGFSYFLTRSGALAGILGTGATSNQLATIYYPFFQGFCEGTQCWTMLVKWWGKVMKDTKSTEVTSKARMATIPQLLNTTVAVYLDPPPKGSTLRAWLDGARVPRFKANPTAARGGGPVYYSVAAVEKLLESKTRGKK